MRSSAESCARQVLHEPLQKLTTTTSPRCSEMRTFSPDRPRATRSGAGWPTSPYCLSAATAWPAGAASASAAIIACDSAAALANKQEITVGSTRAHTGQALPDSTQDQRNIDAADPRTAYLTMSTKQ